MEFLTDFQETFTERLPLQLRFCAKIEDDIMAQVGGLVREELARRPDDGALYTVYILDCRPRLSEDKKVLDIDLCELYGFPTIDEEFDRCSCRISGIIPSPEGCYDHGI